MSDPYIGEIRMLPYTFTPFGWLPCDGQLEQIAEYTALYAILSITYGGDGRVYFGIPHLNGRTPLGAGQGTGLINHRLGEPGGWSDVTLADLAYLPNHNHEVICDQEDGTQSNPDGAFIAKDKKGRFYKEDPDTSQLVEMAEEILVGAGRSQPHENRQPYTAVNFCICWDGVFPPRN